MRSAEEILKSILTIEKMRANNPDYTFNKVIEAMEEYGKQQWNEAIEAILQEVEKTGLIMPNGEENLYFMNRQSILKLKK